MKVSARDVLSEERAKTDLLNSFCLNYDNVKLLCVYVLVFKALLVLARGNLCLCRQMILKSLVGSRDHISLRDPQRHEEPAEVLENQVLMGLCTR